MKSWFNSWTNWLIKSNECEKKINESNYFSERIHIKASILCTIHVSRPDDLDTRSRYTHNTHTSRVSLSDASDTHPIFANTLQIQRRKAVSRSEGIIGAKRVYRCVFACIAACISSRHQNTCFSSVFSMYRASVSERDTCIKLGAWIQCIATRILTRIRAYRDVLAYAERIHYR